MKDVDRLRVKQMVEENGGTGETLLSKSARMSVEEAMEARAEEASRVKTDDFYAACEIANGKLPNKLVIGVKMELDWRDVIGLFADDGLDDHLNHYNLDEMVKRNVRFWIGGGDKSHHTNKGKPFWKLK